MKIKYKNGKIDQVPEPHDIPEDKKEKWGQQLDRLDNLAHALKIPMSPELHFEQMSKVLPGMVDDLKKTFVDITGENPWE